MLDTEFAKQLFVVAAGVVKFRSRRNNSDPRLPAATQVDESVEYFRVIQFLLCTANRDDVTAVGTGYAVCRAHAFATPLHASNRGEKKGGHFTQDSINSRLLCCKIPAITISDKFRG